MTPEDRKTRARIAAATRWAAEPDRTTATAAARQGLRAKFAREIDPDGAMPGEELEYRVDHLMRAHMLRMSLAAGRARRAKSQAKK